MDDYVDGTVSGGLDDGVEGAGSGDVGDDANVEEGFLVFLLGVGGADEGGFGLGADDGEDGDIGVKELL